MLPGGTGVQKSPPIGGFEEGSGGATLATAPLCPGHPLGIVQWRVSVANELAQQLGQALFFLANLL